VFCYLVDLLAEVLKVVSPLEVTGHPVLIYAAFCYLVDLLTEILKVVSSLEVTDHPVFMYMPRSVTWLISWLRSSKL
jgi:hypothetical protein